MASRVIIENFWNVGVKGDTTLREDDLGWPESLKRDAQSDWSETIFRYVIEEVGLNLLFYWVEDRNFYTIETEKTPIEVRRIYPNPNWDGKCEFFKAEENGYGPSTCSAGEVLASFEDETCIWDELYINGIHIDKVLERSAIIDWD